MTLPVILAILVVLWVLDGIAGHYEARLRKHGLHVLTYRWLAAKAWHGKPPTDRGWNRPATRALTPTGHAHRRWWLPGWQHALWRARNTAAVFLLTAGLLVQCRRTVEYAGVTAVTGTALAARRAPAAIAGYSHRKNYVKPLHARLHDDAGIPLSARPEDWLDIPRDLSYARLTWPKGARIPKPPERQAIESTAAATLGMKGAKPSWQFTGPRMSLRLVPPIPPPEWVYLYSIKWDGRGAGLRPDAIRQALLDAGVDEIVLGVGEDGKIVKVDFRADSPHMALSVDTGKGKSTLVRCLLSQVLFRGGIAALLDNKLISHPSLRALPNVAYCDDIGKIHDFLVWLDKELGRRAKYIRANTDFLGNTAGSPGPRLVVVLEEQNLLMNRLRAYWAERVAEDRAKPKEEREYLSPVSPAIRGFENASYVGRELKVHLVFIAQRFSAEAAGGGAKGAAVRMNTGIRILAGYDDDTWKMLVGKSVPMPPSSKHEGRMQVCIKGGDVTEVQVAFFTHAETRQFAEHSDVRVPRELRYLTEFTPGVVEDPVPHGAVAVGSDGAAVVAAPVAALPPGRPWMTIRQAREAGMIPRTWRNPSGTFGTVKHRARKEGRPVPEVKGMKGTQALYDAVELADFLESVTSDSAKVGASA